MNSTTDPETERELHSLDNGLNTLVIRRTYNAEPEEVWDAFTDPDRLVRWFLPVTGDLREGGEFQLEGNASGEILRCQKPTELDLTWKMGGGSSNVKLRLTATDDGTVLELEHSPVPAEIIPNASMQAWGLGAGWEMGLVALGKHLAGELPEGKAADWKAAAPPEQMMAAVQQSMRISDAWAEIIAARD